MVDMRTPNFYCIGAQKAGTTTLHEILKHHPDIYLPVRKEAHFFHKDELYAKGLNWYLQEHFSGISNEKMIGSITPEYLYFEECAKRIFNAFGRDLKFLLILRNPADRAFSHYKMSKFRGFETLSFKKAIEIEENRIKQNLSDKIHFSYIHRGLYHQQIVKYLEYFPLDNFLFINFEDELINNMNKTLTKIFNFLEIEYVDLEVNIRANQAKKAVYPKLNQLQKNKPLFLKKISQLLPKNFKKKIRNTLLDLNKSSSEGEELSQEDKQELITRFFINDIRALKNHFDFETNWIS